MASSYKVLYKPTGKAAEYCQGYALNLYNGCSHACEYCYAPLVRKVDREQFYNDVKPYKDVLEKLRHDLDKMVCEGDLQEVFMSFTSDPLQPCEDIHHLTQQAIRMMELRGIPYRILTKAGYQEFERISSYMTPERCAIGSTLVFCKDVHSRTFEPEAPATSHRVQMLWKAHMLGFKTWVSLEPVWTPEDAFALIKRTHEFVDEYKIGKLNYHPQSRNVDWVKFAHDITEFCELMGVKYELKEDLKRLVGVPA